MPKAKPDQVVVHRIELQETERDTLKLYLMGRTVTSGLQGVGTLFNGLSPIVAAVVGWWIAQFTIDEFKNWIDENISGIRSAHYPHVAEAWEYLHNGMGSLSWAEDETTGTWRDGIQIGLIYDDAKNLFGNSSFRAKDIEFAFGFQVQPFIDNFSALRARELMMSQNKTVQDAWAEWWPLSNAIDKATGQGTMRNFMRIPSTILDTIFGSE